MVQVGRPKTSVVKEYPYGCNDRGQGHVNLKKAQEGTMYQAKDLIDKYGIALITRPTGFGKTYTMMRFCLEFRYKRILYMYPTNIIPQSIRADYHGTKLIKKKVENVDKYFVEFTDSQGKIHTEPFTSKNDLNWWYTDINDPKLPELKSLPRMDFISYEKLRRGWEKLESESEETKQKWMADKLKVYDLIILDEAHRTGASGFLGYWPYIYKLSQDKSLKKNIPILGATATPMRTNCDISLFEDIFYSIDENGKKVQTVVDDFDLVDCWNYNILKAPVYTKCMLDKGAERKKLEDLIESQFDYNIKSGNIVIGSKSKNYGDLIVSGVESAGIVSQKIEKIKSKLNSLINELPDASDSVRLAIEKATGRITGEYLRFIVFYKNSDDMGTRHQEITDIFMKAFNVGGDDSEYAKLNNYYIASSQESFKKYGLTLNKIEDLAERDNEVTSDSSHCKTEIDLIHNIDMLTLGYHVGKTSGVVVSRDTSSEIIYYQQIGRCMKVNSTTTPVIIDLVNSEAELYTRTHRSYREDVAYRIKYFIDNSIHTDEYKKMCAIYDLANMAIPSGSLPDSLIEYMYFNRMAPIYFIMGIAEALKSTDSVKDIVGRLYQMAASKNMNNIDDDSYIIKSNSALTRGRLSKQLLAPGGIISQVNEAVENGGTQI